MNDLDYAFADYDELDTSDRMRACEAARRAAWTGNPKTSAWCALDADDPRRIAFESQYAKEHPKSK